MKQFLLTLCLILGLITPAWAALQSINAVRLHNAAAATGNGTADFAWLESERN